MTPRLAEARVSTTMPLAPATVAESGLPPELIGELVLKVLHRWIELSGVDISRRLGLAFAIIEPTLERLKASHQCEIAGGPLGGPSFRYRLTSSGHAEAAAALAKNTYVGLAPVPIAQYQAYSAQFRRAAKRSVDSEAVRKAFSHLVVADHVLDDIGAAVNAGHSIFIYGPPGNGKTAMARTVRTILPGTVGVPHAIEAYGHIIRVFDPAIHEPAASKGPAASDWTYDRRWIECRPPLVAVGGELTLDALAIGFDPRSGIHQAPIETVANGGVLLIDEFGRQRCDPRELLNWWMVPLESGAEYLRLSSGEKIEMPFFPLVIFATNLKPSELVDEAFLRRIRYKICARNPTPDEFAAIFERYCRMENVSADPAVVPYLLDNVYRVKGLSIRACHARDLVNQAMSIAAYRGLGRRLTFDLLREASDSYFIEDQTVEPERA